jgi:signal peptide peptidase SppA
MSWDDMKEWCGAQLSKLPIRALRDPAPTVNVLRLAGVIGRAGPIGGGGMTLAGMERAIERAFKGRNLKAVALAVNSPGGSPVQASLIAGRIRALAEEKDMPIFAFAEDVAASGGYWLACAADEIFADESSMVGSVGVVSAGFGFPDLLKRHGIERRVHTAGKRKAMLDPFEEEEPEDIPRLRSIQTDIHDAFKRYVRERRGERLNGPDPELFEGDIWAGGQALALGLIDGIGDMRSTLRKRYGERVQMRRISVRTSPLGRLLGRSRVGQGTQEVLAAMGERAGAAFKSTFSPVKQSDAGI